MTNLELIVNDLRRMPKTDLVPFAMRVPDDLIPTIAQTAILEVGITHAVVSDILQARLLGKTGDLPLLVDTWNEAKRFATILMRQEHAEALRMVGTLRSKRMLIYVQAHLSWAKHWILAGIVRDLVLTMD
mgnify:CR=1 FL=1